MKKTYCIAILLLLYIILLCSSCQIKSNKDIIGYWMRSDGYTISFVDDTMCSFGEGLPQTYKIYDKNHLQVVNTLGNGVSEFVFEIDGDVLKIRMPIEEVYTEFTKNEEEQRKIISEVKKKEAIELENQIINDKIGDIQTQIDSYWIDIEKIQNDISQIDWVIENNNRDIEKWEKAIEQEYIDCQEAIDFGDNKEYQENLRDDAIASHKACIQGCQERIEKHDSLKRSCQEEIDILIVEIEKLEQEIKSLRQE